MRVYLSICLAVFTAGVIWSGLIYENVLDALAEKLWQQVSLLIQHLSNLPSALISTFKVFLLFASTLGPIWIVKSYTIPALNWFSTRLQSPDETKENESIDYEWKLNPEIGLLHQPLLWASIVCPALISLSFMAVGAIFLDYSQYYFDLSYNGLNNYIKLASMPLSILAFSIVLPALIARAHGTEQAAKQIKNATTQINIAQDSSAFSNYFKHKEHFESLITKLEKSHCIEIISPTSLYKKLFPDNKPTNKELSTQSEDNEINALINSAIDYICECIETAERDEKTRDEQYMLISNKIYTTLSALKISYNGVKVCMQLSGRKSFSQPAIPYEYDDPLISLNIIYQVHYELMDFAESTQNLNKTLSDLTIPQDSLNLLFDDFIKRNFTDCFGNSRSDNSILITPEIKVDITKVESTWTYPPNVKKQFNRINQYKVKIINSGKVDIQHFEWSLQNNPSCRFIGHNFIKGVQVNKDISPGFAIGIIDNDEQPFIPRITLHYLTSQGAIHRGEYQLPSS